MLGEALGSVAVGVGGVWGYNRENFLYDREMRQKQEFAVMDMRLRQADLWREDVRDMMGLVEKKMDVYTIVNALQLGFCIVLFTEGRLEPGTPQWLLWLYMLSLSGAFTFLLMSVWFAMHASVVAQGNSVRLLTQLVRPPIPSWEQLESMRTYAYAFEGVTPSQALRVPMLQTISEGTHAGPGGFSGKADAPPGTVAADPWGLERRGDDIYELQRRPLPAHRHTRLIREAMRHSQAYDAFARVSMTLGTILLCLSMTYFCLGYALVQDGSPWAACTSVAILQSIASMILRLDVSMTRAEHRAAQVCLMGGPFLSCIAAAEHATYNETFQWAALTILPGSYMLHTCFLLLFLHLCHVEKQPGGIMLPTTFRSILYLDVFGWLVHGKKPPSSPKDKFRSGSNWASMSRIGDQDGEMLPSRSLGRRRSQINAEAAKTAKQAEAVRLKAAVVHGQNFPRHWHKSPVPLRPEDVDAAVLGQEDPQGARRAHDEASRHLANELAQLGEDGTNIPLAGVGPLGVVPTANGKTFAPESFVLDGEERGQSGREAMGPGQAPWFVFRSGVLILAGFWFMGGVWVVTRICQLPDIPDQVLPESVSIAGASMEDGSELDGETITDPGPALRNGLSPRIRALTTFLPRGERVHTYWPTERFLPWAVSCDSSGRHFVISDEFQLYYASMEKEEARPPANITNATNITAAPGAPPAAVSTTPEKLPHPPTSGLRLANFKLAPRCAALEGQAMRDLAVACDHEGTDVAASQCKAFVLHEHGERLAECDIFKVRSSEGPLGRSLKSEDPGAEPVWEIISTWLRGPAKGGNSEEVVSVAVDSACLDSPSKAAGAAGSSGAAAPAGGAKAAEEDGSWCVVVGTTQGRVVRLRRKKATELVPAAALWNAPRSESADKDASEEVVATSLLHVIPGGYLLRMRDERHSVHALNMATGEILGEWRLPVHKGRRWSTLAGGSNHLYLTSQTTGGNHAELWRFPMPARLASAEHNRSHHKG